MYRGVTPFGTLLWQPEVDTEMTSSSSHNAALVGPEGVTPRYCNQAIECNFDEGRYTIVLNS